MSRSSQTKTKAREYRLKRTYGITLAQYDSLLASQRDCCAVCGKHRTKEKTNLHVDHDHKTGEVRGLLCSYCNLRVVGRHRDAGLFEAASRYLRGPFTGWIVPPKRPKKRRRRKKK